MTRSSAPSGADEIEKAILEALRDAKRREETSNKKEREDLECVLRKSSFESNLCGETLLFSTSCRA